ncbi:MAG: hypothetical protein RBR21_08645, partial [Bacteroidales bacterium]|nr:hypothetical protein [Bacteroidales bacterium]
MIAPPCYISLRLRLRFISQGGAIFVKSLKTLIMSAHEKIPKDFFKQFKSKEDFHSFFNDL